MDWTQGYNLLVETQRGPSQTSLQSKLPAPIKRSGPPNARSHNRASSISVDKLRQTFQKPELELKTVSPYNATVPIQSMPSASGDYPQAHRTRLPPRRRVATTPTPNLMPITGSPDLPQGRTNSNLGSPLGRDRRPLTPSMTVTPVLNLSPIMGARTRKSLKTSEPVKIMETTNSTPGNKTSKKISSSKTPSPMAVGPHPNAIRFSSGPVKFSAKKENIPPKRLLGPISPARTQRTPSLQRSRTHGVLSTISSTFSRSNLTLNSRRPSLASSVSTLSLAKGRSNERPTSSPTTAVSELNSDPVHSSNLAGFSKFSRSFLRSDTLGTDPRTVYAAQSGAYWCGRYAAIKDRIRNELMDASMTDPEKYRRIVGPFIEEDIQDPQHEKKGTHHEQLDDDQDLENHVTSCLTCAQVKEDKVALGVFKEIQGWCVTQESRDSFWWWQLRYARAQKNEVYLPKNASMRDSWVCKKTTEMLKNQRDDFGRKSSFGCRFSKTRTDNRSMNDLTKQ